MGRGKQQRGGRQQPGKAEDEDDEPRSLAAQNTNVGMMPPSSSEDESESGDDGPHAQNPKAGMMPPSGSESGSEEEESKSRPTTKAPQAHQLTRKEREALEGKPEEDEMDEEQMAREMERLAMVRKRREEQAAKRIEKDGWDRMKPIGPDNHPPGMREPENGWAHAHEAGH
jgi:hypothetical protein